MFYLHEAEAKFRERALGVTMSKTKLKLIHFVCVR